MSPWQIKRLGNAVLQGAVIAYPTDTIWGFGCHPLNQVAVQRILDIKQRPLDKGLILLASRFSQFKPYLKSNLTSKEIDRIERITDQPTTWLVKASDDCPKWLRGHFPTIAVRLTNHPFVRRLCDSIDAPLVSTSANRAGCKPVRNAIGARRQFGEELDFIVQGFKSGGSSASQIKSLASNAIIRAT